MRSVWREYGVIGVLLIVSVGGYLLYSRNQEDVLRYSLDLIGSQLVALVPEGPDRDRAAVAVNAFKQRVLEDEVAPEQVEAFAASVFNLGSSGESINSQDAELLISLAMDQGDALPLPASFDFPLAPASPEAPGAPRSSGPRVAADPNAPPAGGSGSALAAARPGPETAAERRSRRGERPHASPEAMADLGKRLERITEIYVAMHNPAAGDSVVASGVHFSSQDGLHVIFDERMREHAGLKVVESRLGGEARMIWKSRLGDELAETRSQRMASIERLNRLGAELADSLVSAQFAVGTLTALRRLEARGVVASAEVDSIARSLEARFEVMTKPFAGSVEVAPGSPSVRVRPAESGQGTSELKIRIESGNPPEPGARTNKGD